MISFNFNGVSLSDYGLIVTSKSIPVSFDVKLVQLQSRSFASRSRRLPKIITLEVTIQGIDNADLNSKLDSVKSILDVPFDAQLILDPLPDRYWMARPTMFTGIISAGFFDGTIEFTCADPLAFSLDEVESEYEITTQPQSVSEMVLGSAQIEPIYKLIAGDTLTDVEISVLNDSTGIALYWSGTINDGSMLTIDCQRWIVELDGVPSMDVVEGQFPYLIPGENSIQVDEFEGTLQINYRNRYL